MGGRVESRINMPNYLPFVIFKGVMAFYFLIRNGRDGQAISCVILIWHQLEIIKTSENSHVHDSKVVNDCHSKHDKCYT